MRTISLNVRGIGTADKSKWVRQLICNEKPMVIGIQETKMNYLDENLVNSIWGSDNFGYAKVDAIGSSGGILTVWDDTWFYDTRAMGEEGFLAVVGSWKGKEKLVGFINVYAPQDVGVKKLLWDKIARIINSIDVAWCIFGDFNEVRCREERKNSNFNSRGASNFNEFINSEGLIDIPLGGKLFTRISDDGLKFSKIDRFLVNALFGDYWSSLVVVARERKLSDHCPILLHDKIIDFGRCFDVWMEDKEFKSIVEKCWVKPVFSLNPDAKFRDKLKNVKEGLRIWSKEKFGCGDKQIEELKKEATKWELLAETRDLDEVEMDRWKEVKLGWVEKDKCKNEMLKQKSRIKWVLEGDENLKFFHSYIRRNGKKKQE